jgi:hypothetical protein
MLETLQKMKEKKKRNINPLLEHIYKNKRHVLKKEQRTNIC